MSASVLYSVTWRNGYSSYKWCIVMILRCVEGISLHGRKNIHKHMMLDIIDASRYIHVDASFHPFGVAQVDHLYTL
jgi:hypothetical protein